ncbi:MAG: hypothetical protein IPM84_19815 [Anaerolineae bacterium]|nr:hypothetical protein [Anaerolineae bacterium]
MKRVNKRTVIVAMGLLLLAQVLGACVPGAETVRSTPTAAPDKQVSTPIPDKNTLPAAATLAQQTLATALGVTAAEVKITSVEIRQWRNGCLDLEQPGEMCTQAIVPGYLVMLEVNGQAYEYHTDMNGSAVRPAAATVNPALRAAQQALANSLGKSATEITTVAVEPITWRNGCLEVEQAGAGCSEAQVSGFRIMLKVDGRTYEVRTNQDGSLVVPVPPSDTVLVWHREGGIAGFCDDLSITATGVVSGGSCKGKQGSNALHVSLDANQQLQLLTWLARYRPIDFLMKDPPVPDAMLQTLTFKGSGQTTATEADVNALLAWVNDVYQTLKSTLPASTGKLTPTLQAQPTGGALSSQVKLHGENWPLGQKVNIHLASATVAFDATQVVASSVVGGFGAFDVSVTAPATWPNGAAVSDAILTWIASTPDGGIKATAEFSVTQ